MPLDHESTEKLHGELNALFDERIKDRVVESVERHLPMVDKMLSTHIEDRLRSPTSWLSSETGGELTKWVRKEAESAADSYIRLFGGAPALREIVEQLWDKKAEEYIRGEVQRRLNAILKKMNLEISVNK